MGEQNKNTATRVIEQNICCNTNKEKENESLHMEGITTLEGAEDDNPERKKKITAFLKDLNKNEDEIHQLERETINRGENWSLERRKRVTASFFGKICTLCPESSSTYIVKDMLYPESKYRGADSKKKSSSAAMQYGLDNQKRAIEAFEKIKEIAAQKIKVELCGLFIDTDKCFIAASPAGVVGDDAVVKIKCPYSIHDYSPEEAIFSGEINYCYLRGDKFSLSRIHDDYYQVQGLLHVTKRQYCYYILWTQYGVVYEKIERDDRFWRNEMEKKVETFYMECILPELVDPRYGKNELRERAIFYNTKQSNKQS